ncbi:hypothetical protein AB4520_03955 [Vibrio renipiscarius]
MATVNNNDSTPDSLMLQATPLQRQVGGDNLYGDEPDAPALTL